MPFWKKIGADRREIMGKFLDHMCSNCVEEEHDICWEDFDGPDEDCVCCQESVELFKEIS